MQPEVDKFLEEQTKRAIKTILRTKEQHVDRYLPGDVSRQLRSSVLEAVNGMAEAVRQIVESLSTDQVVLNGLYLEKLDEVHRLLSNGHLLSNGNGRH